MLRCSLFRADWYPFSGLVSENRGLQASGAPIAGNCTAASNGADGMIAMATAAAAAVKASSYTQVRLSLGVETSCFAKTDGVRQLRHDFGTISAHFSHAQCRPNTPSVT